MAASPEEQWLSLSFLQEENLSQRPLSRLPLMSHYLEPGHMATLGLSLAMGHGMAGTALDQSRLSPGVGHVAPSPISEFFWPGGRGMAVEETIPGVALTSF